MAKIVWNQSEIELSDDTAHKLHEVAKIMGISVEDLLTELLVKAVDESPEISGLLAEAQAEIRRRGISMDQYIAEAEGAAHMADLIVRLVKQKR